MPFIDLGKDFGDTKEIPLAPDGEYDLKVVDAEQPAGKNYIMATIEFEGGEYKRFGHFINLPDPDRDAKSDEEKNREPGTTAYNKKIFILRFLKAFSIPYDKNGFDPKDMLGATARLAVTSSVRQNGQRQQDVVLPALPEEGSE